MARDSPVNRRIEPNHVRGVVQRFRTKLGKVVRRLLYDVMPVVVRASGPQGLLECLEAVKAADWPGLAYALDGRVRREGGAGLHAHAAGLARLARLAAGLIR